MDTNIVVLKTPKKISKAFSLFGIIVLALIVVLFSQPGIEKDLYQIGTREVIPMPYHPTIENNVRDPEFTFGGCENIEFNVILLLERAVTMTALHNREQIDNFRKGAKLYLSNLHAVARSRPGTKVHVVIGAFATYNVWQNLPQERIDTGRWSEESKAQINIANPEVLKQQLQAIDDIYINLSPTNPISPYPPEGVTNQGIRDKGYLGGEESRSNVESVRFRQSNLDDALVQSAREVSRWVDGRTNVGPNEDMDLVVAITGGRSNVNNGIDKFPSQSGIFRPNYDLWSGSPNWWLGWWDEPEMDDFWRARQSVARLRTGTALPGYSDPLENGIAHSDMQHGAFSGARPPVRVFGQSLIPNHSLLLEMVASMTYVFGWEWADYSSDPPSFAVGSQEAIINSHRHWDKTIEFIEENELLHDLNLSIKDFPCPSDQVELTPNPTIEISDPGMIAEGETASIEVLIRNEGSNPIVNMDVLIGRNAPISLVPNEIPTQLEMTSNDPSCPFGVESWFPIGNLPCHYTVMMQYGMKYYGGEKLGTIDHLEPGETFRFIHSFEVPIGGAASINSLFQVYLNGQMLFDPVSQTAFNFPVPASSPDDNNAGYFWITQSRDLIIGSALWPT